MNKFQARKKLANILPVLIALVSLVDGHGRLLDPPSRSSAWREGFKTPPDYNDMEGFCGGFDRQWLVNKGKCGICGDAFDELIKPHEAPGGVFATGLLTRNYTEGQIISVRIEITAYHKGSYEFKICPNDNIKIDPPQECFERNPLTFISGEKKLYVDALAKGMYQARLKLPPGITCRQCIIQWTYTTGNRWGLCPNGTQGLGCGPQETFRACSDVGITPRRGTVPVPASPPVILPKTVASDPKLIQPVEEPVKTTSPVGTTKCNRYVGAPNQTKTPGLTDWCNRNCLDGFCPQEFCICAN